eukprot:gene20496-27287_t
MTFLARQAFAKIFNRTPDDLDMHVVYDVSHNIAKIEEHMVDGQLKRLLVHRKGSTRAFPPHHPLIPVDYQFTGQPVLIGGSMGTCSYVLTGTDGAMAETFGSTCHGGGRARSRNSCRVELDFTKVLEDLKTKGIAICVASPTLVCVPLIPAAQVLEDINTKGIAIRVASPKLIRVPLHYTAQVLEDIKTKCIAIRVASPKLIRVPLLPAAQVLEDLKTKGIAIRVASPKLVMEEAPEAYKDVNEVVDTCHAANLSKRCVKLRPIAVIKG